MVVLAEMQQLNRSNVLEVLELIASREQQLQYQRDVPIAHVSAELFCLWDERFSEQHLNLEEYRTAFSSSEIQAMRNFNEVFDRVCSTTPDDLPSIEEFILTSQWKQLSQAANKALLNFRKNDL